MLLISPLPEQLSVRSLVARLSTVRSTACFVSYHLYQQAAQQDKTVSEHWKGIKAQGGEGRVVSLWAGSDDG